jgi:hypothetical protein
MAAAALHGAAANWTWIPTLGAQAVPPEENWADWSAAFTEAFRKRHTMDDWKAAVAALVQQPGESAAHYAHDKAKFHRLCLTTVIFRQKRNLKLYLIVPFLKQVKEDYPLLFSDNFN